jgi:glutamate-1-semialdehyde aminotransferase
MKILKFECEDTYEAEKLASLISVQKDGTVWVTSVAALVGNEIVVQLKDKSSHAVVMKTSNEAEKLRQELSEIFLGRVVVRTSNSAGRMAEIVVD